MKLKLAGLAAAVAMAVSACGSGSGAKESVVQNNAAVETTKGLVIDGEQIAAQDVYDKAKSQTLNLYTGYPEANEKTFIEAFTKDTGIKVNMVRLQPNRLSERVLSEQGAGVLSADVVRISDYRLADGFSKAGVWRSYTVPGSEKFDEAVINSGDFTRTHNAVYTFGYNSQLVKSEDAPKSWAELVDPKWAGKIGVVQGNSGGGVAALNRFMETKLGEDFMSKYAALKPKIYEGSGPQQTALARGEVAVGTVGSANVNIAVKTENAPLNFVVPEEGLITFDYFLGATAKGSNPEAADIFMNYNMSKRGQQIFADLGDYAVNPEIAPPTAVGVKLPAVDSGKVWRMSVEDSKHGEADAAKWKTVFAY